MEPRTGGDRSVRGRWISPASAERNIGLLSRSELAHLRQFGTVHHAPAGTVVAAAGSKVTHVEVVSEGELELRVRQDEDRVTMAVVRAGGVIADIPLLLNTPMPFDVIASRDTECIRLSRHLWTELLNRSPYLALRWMASIARRLDDDRRRLVVVTTKPLVAQFAYLLLELAEDAPNGDAVVRLSHTTIAHLLRARRQPVTRVFGELKRAGMVDARYGLTVIRDSEGLRRVMGPEPLP